MRFTEIELQCEDILWFAIDVNGHIMAFTSGGAGCVPEFVCGNKENTYSLQDYFLDEYMPDLKLEEKGLFCYDVNYDDNYGNTYIKTSTPESPINFNDLPDKIKELLKLNTLDLNANTSDTIEVKHAY